MEASAPPMEHESVAVMRRRLHKLEDTLRTREAQLATALQETRLLQSELQNTKQQKADQALEAMAQRASILIEIEAGDRRAAEHRVAHAAVTAELTEQEGAAQRSRQEALMVDAELALLGSELGATEQSLRVAEQRRARAVAAAAEAIAGGVGGPLQLAPRQDEIAPRTRDDGLTSSDASTGPSSAETLG